MLARYPIVPSPRAAVLTLALLGSSASAQDAAAITMAPVTMGWESSRPLAFETTDGTLSGLYVDLAHHLGAEIGFDVEFLRVSNLEEWLETFRTGQTQIIPGIPKLPSIQDTTVFSNAAFAQQVRLMVRTEDAALIDLANLNGRRIGVIPPTSGSDPALLPDATILAFPNANAALIELLNGDIDAISAPTYFTLPAARAARVDHRVAFTSEHLLEYELFVGLHKDRADLLGPINTALAAMAQDGRLSSIATRYGIEVPQDTPDTLTVGVYHFPPYQVVHADGSFTGFGVETLRDLADRAGLGLDFKEITLEQWQAGPSADSYDLLPQAGINADRSARMDFTYPIEQAEVSIFVRAGQSEGITGLSDLSGLRVGTSATSLGRRLATAQGDMTLLTLGDQHDHLNSLLNDRTDAILYPPQAIRELAAVQGVSDQITEIKPAIFTSERAPALRTGLGDVRERFNFVIPRYLISDRYRYVHEQWFGNPIFWTKQRVNTALGVATLAILSLGAFLVIQRQRQQARLLELQRRELRKEATYTKELENVVRKLERSNENLNDFAYIASHDLKEPLRGIAINANFLMREDMPDTAQKRVARMATLTNRMERLISDLLYFSRLGRDEENREHVDLNKLLGHLKADLRETLDQRCANIRIETPLPLVSAEPARVRTVFYNLILNGLTYNDQPQKLAEIGFLNAANVNGKQLTDVFYVKDNGIGIAEKNREKVFRIFTRLNKEADYGRGTGAGLSFVKKVLETYNCNLTFTSEQGVGTTFYFTLPLVEISNQHLKVQERDVA